MADPDYLKLIQAVITRMAGNSFFLKGWTVTLVAGLTAFAKADSNRSFAWIAVFVVVVFGVLDAYYLALERAYRGLYESTDAGGRRGLDAASGATRCAGHPQGKVPRRSVWTR
jgi:hypothetical protein